MASFADVQYCIYGGTLGRSRKVQNYDDVIYGWSFRADLTLLSWGLLNRVFHIQCGRGTIKKVN